MAKAIPDGYHTATPYLTVHDGAGAIEFYKRVFGATETLRLAEPSGKVGHAEIKIGDSTIMLADEMPECNHRSPRTLGGAPGGICLYVEDADAVFERAVAAGAEVRSPMTDQFYGDRSGTVIDPFGHVWTIATHKEDVPPEEITRRFEDYLRRQGG
jgi:PhnB protein